MTYEDLHLITHWAQVVQLRDDDLLTPAELALIDAASRGESATISQTVPNLKSPHVLIRAALLRYLILGGCKDFRTQPSGVTVNGAWIGGRLDLRFTKAYGPIDLYNCYVAERAELVQLQADGLAIVGATLVDGINASRLRVTGNVTLNGSRSEGKISLSGAEIGGHLSCVRASLRKPGGSALKAQGMTVSSSVLLEGTVTEGMVSFLGAQIGGQLVCIGSDFSNMDGHALQAQSARIQGDVLMCYASCSGEVSFLGAEIGGVFDCSQATLRKPNGLALNAQRLVLKEGFVWRRIQGLSGTVDLTSAHVGDLWDDPESWAQVDTLFLSGFLYDHLHGRIDVDDRLAWLKKGAVSRREFYPQPYEQLAKLLRDTGHRSDARAIMVAKEKEQRRAARMRWHAERQWRRDLVAASRMDDAARTDAITALTVRRPTDENLSRLAMLYPVDTDKPFTEPMTLQLAQQQFRAEQRGFILRKKLSSIGSVIADRIFGLVVGYGHKPERSFYMLVILIAVGWFLADRAWKDGDFAPTIGPVLMSQGWQSLATDVRITNPAQVWSDKFMLSPDGVPILTEGRDYETFHPVAYAVDVVVPIISLGQEASWAPSTTRGPWGWWLWWVRWFLTALGWIVTAIGAAAVTGVIRRD